LFQLFATGVVDAGGKFATGVVDAGGKFAPVSLTPVVNFMRPGGLPKVAMTTAANGINDTSSKFATGINDTCGKFSTGVNYFSHISRQILACVKVTRGFIIHW
jgi:hypothetical protein